jgi:hypothetical protein
MSGSGSLEMSGFRQPENLKQQPFRPFPLVFTKPVQIWRKLAYHVRERTIREKLILLRPTSTDPVHGQFAWREIS